MSKIHLKPVNLYRFVKVFIGQYKLLRKGRNIGRVECIKKAKRFAMLALVWPK